GASGPPLARPGDRPRRRRIRSTPPPAPAPLARAAAPLDRPAAGAARPGRFAPVGRAVGFSGHGYTRAMTDQFDDSARADARAERRGTALLRSSRALEHDTGGNPENPGGCGRSTPN